MTSDTPILSYEPYHFLRSGVPTLDALLYGNTEENTLYDRMGIQLVDDNGKFLDPTSLCISGPDGTGKSVFAMHYAAHYAADCAKAGHFPRILYISTDLNYNRALKVWKNFLLDDPLNRKIPFTDAAPQSQPVDLMGYIPGSQSKNGQSPVTDYLLTNPPKVGGKPIVAFINLATETAGDDWDYINRILGSVEQPAKDEPKHLIVLDAAEGLETLVGEYDGYGEKRSRRSRVAQFVRAAMQKFHILLVTEEAAEDARLPEQYVTDFVLRLRNIQVREKTNAYTRRTMEIEKSRGQSAIRGQHAFTIRNGKGSTTGKNSNPDDPRWDHPAVEDKTVSYAQVMHSLDYINRRIMMQSGENIQGPCRDHFAGFGIEHLDNMLDSNANFAQQSKGVPSSSVTALIGEYGTHKIRLATAFLSQCFCPGVNEIAILITTSDIDANGLAERVFRHLHPEADDADPNRQPDIDRIKRSILCRRLEKHDISEPLSFISSKRLCGKPEKNSPRPFGEPRLRQIGISRASKYGSCCLTSPTWRTPTRM